MGNNVNPSNIIEKAFQPLQAAGWSARPSAAWDSSHDAVMSLQAPSGERYHFLIEVKNRLEPRDVPHLVAQFSRMDAGRAPLVVAPYLGPRTRDLLSHADIPYADETGNIRIAHGPIYIERRGSSKPPLGMFAGARASLRGEATGRIVRYLADHLPPAKIREVANAAHAYPGNVSRLASYLDREHLIVRDPRGTIVEVHWEPLLRLWSESLAKERRSTSFMDPRGAQHLVSRLRGYKGVYAVTGAFAASKIAPVAHVTSLDVYVEDQNVFARELELHRADGFSNVRVIDPFDPVAFERGIERDAVRLASPSQIAADLLTLPKRSNDEYDALIGWMQRHEKEWRIA